MTDPTATTEPTTPAKKIPAIFMLLLIALPFILFATGWRTLDLSCQRTADSAQCQVTEHFAGGLYNRQVSANSVNDLIYQTPVNAQVKDLHLTTVAFQTANGNIPLDNTYSDANRSDKRHLVQAFREWKPSNRPDLQYHAEFVSIFGWLGVLGMLFLAYKLLTWPYRWFQARQAHANSGDA